ncbi:1-acyl-sn-glycerol-3-phosphate acyltransferase [Fluviicoccus keumensis]|uniref:1-acyl-sn-glycerol-3-phosphate acyltransferase n=1 Tax=Fluviicoccus keumensis TaxID=1435465 RepID=A0A4Q7Z6C7_9GAMM|nr:acyltransferase [Fluviicoccus keumensis]RZU45293.1 1-acyl-sn-glycerol-3-phosphate acyltransferase [Fluviicoccus keumensis]
MLGFLPAPILGLVTLTLLIINTAIHAGLITVGMPLKVFLPHWNKPLTRFFILVAENWAVLNKKLMQLLPPIEWHVDIPEELDYRSNYFLVSNHQSWIDVIVLFSVFSKRIPFIRFFTKQELLWIPLLGMALVAMDFPFMKRYSKDFLARKPHLRGKDIETTRNSCTRISRHPFAILNFLEGTRYTPEKHRRQDSPYIHLLKPKSAGVAFAFAALGPEMKNLLDVTILYPEGRPSFVDFWSGRVRRVIVSTKIRSIPVAYTQGDYENDPIFREEFQGWISRIWQEKDLLMSDLNQRT